jgi:hypothetical protein
MSKPRKPRKILNEDLAAKISPAADSMPADICWRKEEVFSSVKDTEHPPPYMSSYLDHVLKEDFEKTGNPVIAWGAYHYARTLRMPIPEWVLAYLDKSAELLLNPENQPNDIPVLLGFKKSKSLGGGAQAFKQAETYNVQRTSVLILMHILESYPDKSLEDACFLTEPFVQKISNGRIKADMYTIRKWYYDHTKT